MRIVHRSMMVALALSLANCSSAQTQGTAAFTHPGQRCARFHGWQIHGLPRDAGGGRGRDRA